VSGCCSNKSLRICLYSITAIRHLHGYGFIMVFCNFKQVLLLLEHCKGTTFFETTKYFFAKNFYLSLFTKKEQSSTPWDISCIVCLDNTRPFFYLFRPPCIVCLDNTRPFFYLFSPPTIVCLDNSSPCKRKD